MDDKDFKKHLKDLAHGHHHPEEHDWATEAPIRKTSGRSSTKGRKTAKTAARKTKRRAA
jgi:hypothetical protein